MSSAVKRLESGPQQPLEVALEDDAFCNTNTNTSIKSKIQTQILVDLFIAHRGHGLQFDSDVGCHTSMVHCGLLMEGLEKIKRKPDLSGCKTYDKLQQI